MEASLVTEPGSEAGGPAPAPARPEAGNLLLRALLAADYALVQPHLSRVPVAVGERLAESGAPFDRLLFPEGGIAGFVDVLRDGREVAIGLLGREGFTGWPMLLAHDRWPHTVVARAADATALALDAARLPALLAASEALRRLLLRHAAAFMTQLTATIASNLLQSVEQRIARWLLMYHDRVDGDELVVTHDELGVMLGVRRASITAALHQLEGDGAIRGQRGRVLVRDRAALVALAGATYGRAEAEQAWLVGGQLKVSD